MRLAGPSVCLASLLLARLASGQPAPMTLEDCVRAAQSGPSAVGTARLQVDVAGLGVARARAAFRPQARLLGGLTYNSARSDAPGQPSFVALNGPREYLALASAELELDTSGRLRAERERARADLDAAGSGVRLAERELRRAVAASFYRVLLARRVARVARDSLAEAQAFEARTRLLLAQGEASGADVAKASAQVAQEQQAVEGADLDAELANHELASFWTSDVTTPLPLEDTFDRPPPLPALALDPAAADGPPALPELELLDAQRRGLLAESRRARADRLPQASLAFQYGVDALQARWSDRGYAVLVNVDVPLVDWSRARDAARQLDLQAQQLQDQRRQLERLLSRDLADAVSRVRSGHAQLATTGSRVELSREDLRLSRLRYDGGEGPALDVVAAQSQLADARTAHYAAVAAYLASLVDLELAAGR